jgi:hypothetical protein
VDEVRCPSRIHGLIVDGRSEVKCPAKHCGAGKGVVVFHYYSLPDFDFLETRKFQDPKKLFESTTTRKD